MIGIENGREFVFCVECAHRSYAPLGQSAADALEQHKQNECPFRPKVETGGPMYQRCPVCGGLTSRQHVIH